MAKKNKDRNKRNTGATRHTHHSSVGTRCRASPTSTHRQVSHSNGQGPPCEEHRCAHSSRKMGRAAARPYRGACARLRPTAAEYPLEIRSCPCVQRQNSTQGFFSGIVRLPVTPPDARTGMVAASAIMPVSITATVCSDHVHVQPVLGVSPRGLAAAGGSRSSKSPLCSRRRMPCCR